MKTFAFAATAALLLSGCAAGLKAAQPGNYAAKVMTVPLQQSWSVADSKYQGAQRANFTKDGFGLNQMSLVLIEEGHDMKPGKDKSEEPVNYEPGMSQLDMVEFMQASLAAIGYTAVDVSNVAPAQFVGQSGITMDLSGKYETGLNLRGVASMAETDQGLAVGFFVAPSRFYFDRDADEARAALAGARLR